MFDILFDILLGNWVGPLLRFIGVCVLYVLGRVKLLFQPSAKPYSFKAIYNMDYDRQDSYQKMMERAGNK
jgi:hypothetical protein